MRGIDLALQEHGYQAGGKRISAVAASSDASPESVIDAARNLVEKQKVNIVIGPLASNEGLAIREYAKTQPGTTFVNGSSAAQELTLQSPAANFFRFTPDAVQWQAGLGQYAYKRKSYQSVVTLAEDYSFGHDQVKGFVLDYCRAGGKIVDKLWLDLENEDIDALVNKIPQDIDAIYIALSSTIAMAFFKKYLAAAGTEAKPFIAGALTIDQNMLLNEDRQYDFLLGTLSSTPVPVASAWENEDWTNFVKNYQEKFWNENDAAADAGDDDIRKIVQAQFSRRFRAPSFFAYSYYVNTKAVLLALELINGDLSSGQVNFRAALSDLNYKSPTGAIKLDQNHQAITDIFVTQIARDANGLLYQKVESIISEVNETMRLPADQFQQFLNTWKSAPGCP
jgi:branched-chain amino acid transport system substrate-binding protein